MAIEGKTEKRRVLKRERETPRETSITKLVSKKFAISYFSRPECTKYTDIDVKFSKHFLRQYPRPHFVYEL